MSNELIPVNPNPERHPRKGDKPSKLTLSDAKSVFSLNPTIQQRRLTVFKWMMDGCFIDGERVTQAELAMYLNEKPSTVDNDIWYIKQKLGFMFKTDERIREEVAATAGLLVKINLEDRGRALDQYNKILKDIDLERSINGIPSALRLQAAAQFLKLANDCARGLDKFLEMLTKAAGTIHIHGNAVVGDNAQQANQETNIFNPVQALKMLEDRGFQAKIGQKKVEIVETEFEEIPEDG